MCFKCQNCKSVVSQNIPQAMVVVKSRKKTYTNYFDGRWPIQNPLLSTLTEEDKKKLRVKETTGTEIVKEISVCPDCEFKLTGKRSYIPPENNNQVTYLPEKAQVTLTNVPVEYISIPARMDKRS